jgi:uncharacterized protein involved in response to NO
LVGVLLWPLFYAGAIAYFPSLIHARLMVQGFGAAFVVGFLSTAAPRFTSSNHFSIPALILLLALHSAAVLCHLGLSIRTGDLLFALFLLVLLLLLAARLLKAPHQDPPPPALSLALVGLSCGAVGAIMLALPRPISDPAYFRLAHLLLYQGLLLLPVLALAPLLVPRLLGGDFGEPPRRRAAARAALLTLALLASFVLESFFHDRAGYALRTLAAFAYLALEIPWRRPADAPQANTLARALPLVPLLGFSGMVAATLFYPVRIGLEHLLYIGGLGLLMLLVSSHVVLGHADQLDRRRRSWPLRLIVALVIVAATTRASGEIWPQIMVSHNIYAASLWAITAILWLAWQARRLLPLRKEYQ